MRDATPLSCKRDDLVADVRCPDRVVLRDRDGRFMHAADIGHREEAGQVIAALADDLSEWARGHLDHAEVRRLGTVTRWPCR